MKTPPELYVCIYVREFPAQALLRLRPELRETPCVVLEDEAPQQTVCALNTRARLLGLRHGMTKVEVDTFEGVIVFDRSLRTESLVQTILLECAGGFSPRIEDRSVNSTFVCVVDASGTESLFGPSLMLAKQIRQRLRAIGISASIPRVRTFMRRSVLPAASAEGFRFKSSAPDDEAKALSTLPLSVLDMTEALEETFRAWGIRTVGAFSALPEKSLISRLGQDGKRLLQCLSAPGFPYLLLLHLRISLIIN